MRNDRGGHRRCTRAYFMGLPPKISCQHNVRAKASSLRPSYIAGDKPIPQPQTRHRKSALSTCAPVRLYKEKKTKEGIRGGRISVDTTNHPRQVPLYPSLIRFRGFNPPTPPQFSSSVFLRIRLSRVISFFVCFIFLLSPWVGNRCFDSASIFSPLLGLSRAGVAMSVSALSGGV